MQKVLKVCQQKGKNKFDFEIEENDLNYLQWIEFVDY